MTPQPRVLVYCANGVQGQAITRVLLASGCHVRALVRDAVRAEALATAGAELYEAHLDDAIAL
jgi:uncharacterized protein YbjT (DUF2867 family)